MKNTLESVIKMLTDEYEKAKAQVYIRDPLAFALYQVWKIVDQESE